MLTRIGLGVDLVDQLGHGRLPVGHGGVGGGMTAVVAEGLEEIRDAWVRYECVERAAVKKLKNLRSEFRSVGSA